VSISATEFAEMYGYELKVNYDSDLFEYSGGLSSKIAEIGTIFAKEFDDYVLIGATKIGNQPGFSGNEVAVLQLTLTATTDGSMPVITISDISIVTADMEYVRNIGNWNYNIALAS